MPYISEYNHKLKEMIRIQRQMLDAANRVIAMQAKQLEQVMYDIHRSLKLDMEEPAEATEE